jgi:hypothetical protein
MSASSNRIQFRTESSCSQLQAEPNLVKSKRKAEAETRAEAEAEGAAQMQKQMDAWILFQAETEAQAQADGCIGPLRSSFSFDPCKTNEKKRCPSLEEERGRRKFNPN